MGAMSLPPGFRFHPTDDELVGYYLKRKVDGLKIELEVIPVVDLYKFDPWELPDKSFLPMRDMEWFFFVPRDRKYPNGSRTNRATGSGYWKATGKDRKVVCEPSVTGLRKTLVFYKGRAPAGDRTDWVMHEYRLCEELPHGNSTFVGAFALCRIVKRSEHGQKTSETIGEPRLKRAVYSTNSLYSGSRSTDMIDAHESQAEMFGCRANVTPPTTSTSENKSGSESEPIVIESDQTFNENSYHPSDASEAFLVRDVHSELNFPIQLTNSLIHSPSYISSQIPFMWPYTDINAEACATSNFNEIASAMLPSPSSSNFMDVHTPEAYAGYPSLDFGTYSGNMNLATSDAEAWNPVMLPPICRQTSGDGSGELSFWLPDESVVAW